MKTHPPYSTSFKNRVMAYARSNSKYAAAKRFGLSEGTIYAWFRGGWSQSRKKAQMPKSAPKSMPKMAFVSANPSIDLFAYTSARVDWALYGYRKALDDAKRGV